MTSKFPLSQKYIDFINSTHNVSADFLEGTTASGKTTVGAGVKFMRMVSASPKKLHIIASKTTGTAEKNIIQQDNGILDLHRNAQYFGNGDKDNKLPHIKFEGKIIYVLGYDNKDKWQNVLGSQFGCVYIDEINTADIEFVREISTRNDYLMATLNPDDPSLPVYKEFVNRSRPYKKYAADVPKEIMAELTEEPVPNWRYWFFSFRDNLSLTQADIDKKIQSAPKGTKLYKNKILGLRGRATGLVFDLKDSSIITLTQVKSLEFVRFSAALDTAYSQTSPDTIAFTFTGITADRKCVVLDELVYNNRDLKTPISPSDIPKIFVDFLEKNRAVWGFARDVYIDSADQATITECLKYKRLTGCIYNFIPNCRHDMSLYKDGVTKIPEPIDSQKDLENYRLQQKQRAMERHIRKLRRFQVGSCDPETAKAYSRRVKQAQADLKQFIADNSAVLHREFEREKIYENSQNLLTNGHKSDIIISKEVKPLEQAKKRDHKIYITDIAINKISKTNIPYFSLEQNEKIYKAHKELLKISKVQNDSNEVAYLFNLNSDETAYQLGEEHRVNIFKNPYALSMANPSKNVSLFLAHNHPSTQDFSYSDIGVLLLNDNFKAISVVSNMGDVHILYKSSKYDFQKAMDYIKSVRSNYNESLDDETDRMLVKDILKGCEKIGILQY